MTWLTSASRLFASALLLCAAGEASAAEQQSALGLPSFEGKQTINQGAVAIEGTMLASTAFDRAAQAIATAVDRSANERSVLVLGSSDTIDFGAVAMLQTEMEAITMQLQEARDTRISRNGGHNFAPAIAPLGAVPVITSVAGLLRSDTDISAVDVNLDSRVLTAAVAAHLKNALIPTAIIGAEVRSPLKTQFDGLGKLAKLARADLDALAPTNPTGQAKTKLERLDAALKRYDTFAEQATTAEKGVVPLVAASRLSHILEGNPLILRVNAEKSGGTLLKRTNILTFFGADGVSISSGLVASYQMTEPSTGKIAAAGVVTCRTGLTKLKAVQDDTWKPVPRRNETVTDPPAAICRSIASTSS